VTGTLLGAVAPVAAPGYRLEVTALTWVPEAYVTRHFHPLAIVVCVQEGALGFAIHQGAATLTRGGDGEQPASSEPLVLDTEVTLEPRDCVAFDEFAAHTIHSAWNASAGETVTWEADLVQDGEPFTTFVDAAGTPVPA
jgi:predicted metal-dependent enzyme (double-stranded beta helix superfamily)